MSSNTSELIQTGLRLHQAGRLQEAETYYRAVIRKQPENPDAWHLLGVIAQQTGNDKVSAELAEKAINLRPDVPDYYVTCGEAYRAMRAYDSAMRCYEKALAINPLHRETHYNMALLYEQLENLDLAVRHYQQFIQLSSKSYPELVSRVKRHLNALMKTRAEK